MAKPATSVSRSIHSTHQRPSLRLLLLVHFLPGLLAGTLLAGLIFFLNPDLPYSAPHLLRASLIYGGLLGLLTAGALSAITWPLGARAVRILPWSITAVLALAALGHWVSAAHNSFYLPPGINVRMIKAALWLTLITLVCFYTALVHTHQGRPYGWRSKLGLVALALASVYAMAERREAFKPRPRRMPLPSAVESRPRPHLVVVALDGATLDTILPLARQGRLPFFGHLIENGAYGHCTGFAPVRRSALWTTVATGKLPYQHGVLGDRDFPADILGRGVRLRLLPTLPGFATWGALGRPSPTDASSRQSPALWEILARLDLSIGLVGWPLTFPVPRTSDFAFSDLYFTGDLRHAAARPRELAERGVLFRLDAEELDSGLLEQLGSRLPYSLLETLAEDLWRESLTLFLLEQRQEVRALFLMLPGLGSVSQDYYGGYAAVELGGSRKRPAQEAAGFLTGYYRHADDFLANLWQRLSAPRVLAVVSAHGFEAPEGWRKLWFLISGRPFEGTARRAPAGVFLLLGDGIRPGTFLEQADLVDVVPTLLYALGFPIARDLDGEVLTPAFENSYLARHPLTFVPSYETLATQTGEL